METMIERMKQAIAERIERLSLDSYNNLFLRRYWNESDGDYCEHLTWVLTAPVDELTSWIDAMAGKR